MGVYYRTWDNIHRHNILNSLHYFVLERITKQLTQVRLTRNTSRLIVGGRVNTRI